MDQPAGSLLPERLSPGALAEKRRGRAGMLLAGADTGLARGENGAGGNRISIGAPSPVNGITAPRGRRC